MRCINLDRTGYDTTTGRMMNTRGRHCCHALPKKTHRIPKSNELPHDSKTNTLVVAAKSTAWGHVTVLEICRWVIRDAWRGHPARAWYIFNTSTGETSVSPWLFRSDACGVWPSGARGWLTERRRRGYILPLSRMSTPYGQRDAKEMGGRKKKKKTGGEEKKRRVTDMEQ